MYPFRSGLPSPGPAPGHDFYLSRATMFRHEFSSAEHGRRLDLYARSHGRGNCDPIDEGPLGARGLSLGDRVRKCLDVLDQFLLRKRRLADARMDDAGFFDPELDRPALGALDRIRN